LYEHYDFEKIRPIRSSELNTTSEILTHRDVTVKFVVDRGVSHELVRHRPASFAQESTRYCNYGKDKFGNHLTFIDPYFFEKGSPEWTKWKNLMEWCETDYLQLIAMGAKPEEARTVLPNSIKTEVIMTANCKEWKHFFELRACNKTGKAHPQMLEVTRPLLDDFKAVVGSVFEDLNYE
jgi:thymidylate synthase (FAD)